MEKQGFKQMRLRLVAEGYIWRKAFALSMLEPMLCPTCANSLQEMSFMRGEMTMDDPLEIIKTYACENCDYCLEPSCPQVYYLRTQCSDWGEESDA